MRKITLLTSVLLTAPFAAGNVSAQCVVTQDCATLGYTETSCQNGGIKCPFGDKWACPNKNINNPDCTYGSYYYSDGTCSKSYTTAKKVIGVVVTVIGNEKWVISLQNYSEENWALEDVAVLKNYAKDIYAATDFKSCENTDAMLALGEDKYPSAKAARAYYPANAPQTKGKWCLPAAGVLNMITIYQNEIEAAIIQAGGDSILSARTYFWTSTECDKDLAWSWYALAGDFYIYGKSTLSYLVRPVMKIE